MDKEREEIPISLKVENARIEYALRNVRENGLRIYEPGELVNKAISQFGDKLAISCSFGACSVVVLKMALDVNPHIKVVFNNTGVEYPETYAYKKLLVEKWKLNLIETKPLKSFWKCVKEYGFPLIRSRYSWKQRKKKTSKPECCIYLKELPMKNACKEFNIEASLTGLRASESGVRMFTLAQRGQIYHTKKYGSLWRIHPIGFWNRVEVFDYLRRNNIPINEIYSKGKDRSGCMPCTSFINWEKQLAKANLKMYKWVQKLRKVPLIDDYLTLENEVYRSCSTLDQKVLEEWF